MVKLIDDNDDKWQKRLEDDRKELLRIQDKKTDMKLKASKGRTTAEFAKLRAEMASFASQFTSGAERVGLPTAAPSARSSSVGARPRFVPHKVFVQGFFDFDKAAGDLSEEERDNWGAKLLDAVPLHIRSKFSLDKSYPKSRRLVFTNSEGG